MAGRPGDSPKPGKSLIINKNWCFVALFAYSLGKHKFQIIAYQTCDLCKFLTCKRVIRPGNPTQVHGWRREKVWSHSQREKGIALSSLLGLSHKLWRS